jgi:hypothetical protein
VTARSPEASPSGGAANGEHGSAAIGGETFEIAEPAEPVEEEPAGAQAQDEVAAPAEVTDVAAVAASAKPTHARHGATHGAAAAAAEAPAPPPALYGAVGERGTVDLSATFKSMFSSAGLQSPIWRDVPVGFYAAGDVSITIDESGAITRTTMSADATPALRSEVARIVQIIKGHTFTAHAATTRMHLVVRVTDKVQNGGRVMIDKSGAFELTNGRRFILEARER